MRTPALSAALLLIATVTSRSQSTRPVTVKRESPAYFTESYSVLVKDGQTRHGAYAKNGLLNRGLVRGYYKLGLKDSVWSFYHAPSGKLQSRGRYRAGQKVDMWEYWNWEGKLTHRYNHTSGKLELPPAPIDTTTHIVEQSGKRQRLHLSSPLLFLGGDETRWLGHGYLRYPAAALKRQVSGRVVVEFVVNEQGNAGKFRVLESLDPALDAEALRATRQSCDNLWLPGNLGGKPVEVICRLPITFHIN